jgi:hypothetical protein
MALQKQNISLNFLKGVNTKTDDKQQQLGEWLTLENIRLTEVLAAQKRFGFDELTKDRFALVGDLAASQFVATNKDQLLLHTGEDLYSYSPNELSWKQINSNKTLQVQEEKLVQNALNQLYPEVRTVNNVQVYAYTEQGTGIEVAARDIDTKVSLIDAFVLPNSGTPGVNSFRETNPPWMGVAGDYVLVIYNNDTDASEIRIQPIDTSDPENIPSNILFDFTDEGRILSVTSDPVSQKVLIVFDNDGVAEHKLITIDSSLTISPITAFTISDSFNRPTFTTSFVDDSSNFWVGYVDFSLGDGYLNYYILDDALATVLGDTQTTAFNPGGDTDEQEPAIVGAYFNGEGVFYFTRSTTSLQDTPSRTTRRVTTTVGGATLSIAAIDQLNGLFLASTPVELAGSLTVFAGYKPTSFTSPRNRPEGNRSFQPSLFAVSDSGFPVRVLQGDAVFEREAEEGTRIQKATVPQPDSNGNIIFPYSSADRVTTESGSLAVQSGVVFLTLTPDDPSARLSLEIAGNTLFAGANLTMYDGQEYVEHGFHLFPEWENRPATITQTISNVQFSSGSVIATAPEPLDTNLLRTGAIVTGPFVPANTSIFELQSGGRIRLTNAAVGSGTTTLTVSGGALKPGGNYQYVYVYEWVDANGNLHQSAPSPAYSIESDGGNIFTVTVTTTVGSNQVTTTSWEAFGVGNEITSPNFPAGTQIIESGPNFLRFNNDATASGSVIINTTDTGFMTVRMRPLYQTAKIGNSPVSLALYRTVDNGSIFYRVSRLNEPTINDPSVGFISYFDIISDGALIGNQQLYTNGGVVENAPLKSPIALGTYKDRAVAVVKDNESSFRFSKEVIPGVPVEWSDFFTFTVNQQGGDVTAIAEMDDKLIIWKSTSVFYLTGNGPAPTGVGSSFGQPIQVAADTGCDAPASVVLTPVGLMFQSRKGIYLLDRGLNLQYIGAQVEQFNDLTISRAILADERNEVRFFTEEGTTLVYDYFIQQWYVHTDQESLMAVTWQRKPTYVDSTATVSVEDDTQFTDEAAAIEMRFETGWLNFAGINGFQRVYLMEILGEYKSEHTLTVNIYTEFDETAPSQTVTVEPSADKPYQYRVFIKNQKTTSMKIEIIENQPAGSLGEGLSASALSFRVGVKAGLSKLAATRSFGD